MQGVTLSVEVGWLCGEGTDLPYGLFSAASMRAVLAARGDGRDPDDTFVPYVEVLTEPPTTAHCALLAKLGAGPGPDGPAVAAAELRAGRRGRSRTSAHDRARAGGQPHVCIGAPSRAG